MAGNAPTEEQADIEYFANIKRINFKGLEFR